MKKNNLLQGAIVALLVASPLAAHAGQYPAADFEPKVLYQDESVKSTPASTPATKVATAEVSTPAPVVSAADDSKYPASNFEPKILFKDDTYKPSKSAPVSEYTTSAGAVIMEEAAISKAEKEGDKTNLLLLGALVVAGFAASRCPKFAGIFGGSSVSNETSSAPQETGVTRYLNARIPKVSGVTKYLDRVGKPTNVARYIAKQNLAQKAAAAQNDANRG
ncbi:MAG: hypothetical protein PHN45_02935 [Methylococcales bacterium]|nr:hypothetical protein [Methylococcales bacterium]MDD5753687.1 hypothetical protein [Methylococcales bacterium]